MGITGCIILNTLIMCLKVSPRPSLQLSASITTSPAFDYMEPGFFGFLFWSNIILTTVFLCESILKIIGLGPRIFRTDRMNVFDLTVVLFSILEIVIDLLKRDGAELYFPLPLSVLAPP